MLPGLPALALALLALAPGPAGEDVYTWTDEQGVAHYTNEPNLIPRRYRDQARTRTPCSRCSPRLTTR